MKFVIFGLTISSSWGNGHATLWRGLCRALTRQGHRVVFFERDTSWYAGARDWHGLPGCDLVLFADWDAVRDQARRELADADAAIVTSYCADALAARAEILDAQRPLAVFYDLDTPVTLAELSRGGTVPYIGADGLAAYDLVLSYTGGAALEQLRAVLGARRVQALYGHVDPHVHRATQPQPHFRADLAWLGTYARERQDRLEELFVRPARLLPQCRFLIAGAQYPQDFPWSANVYFVRHLPPDQHAAFLSSARIQLNVTREQMARMGWCPSGRLFEAAACGAAILSDEWPGLDDFYAAGAEILIARNAGDTLAALELDDATLRRIGNAARDRTLAAHTSEHRACELIAALEQTFRAPAASANADRPASRVQACGA